MNYKTKTLIFILICIMTITVVCATEGHVDISGDVNVTYHGSRTSIGSDYPISIEYEDQTYYVNDADLEKLATTNEDFEYLYDYHQNFNSPDATIKGNHYEFEKQCNNTDFSFDYIDGQTVGNDSDANVVTKLYNADGSEI